MTYKSMFLSILLVPPAVVCSDAKDKRIQQLEEEFFQKELELSNLGKMIAEKDELISTFSRYYQTFFGSFVERELIKLQKNCKNSLSEEEKNNIAIELAKTVDEFVAGFLATVEKGGNIKGMLVNGLASYNEAAGIKEFESFKFYLIRYVLEQNLIFDLVKKYEECLQELITIQAKAMNLRK